MAKKVWIYGDSVLKGVMWSGIDRRYRIADGIGYDRIAQRYGMEIDNRSHFGCTSGKGLLHLERAMEREALPDAMIIEYGGNDCDFNWREVAAAPDCEHKLNTAIDEYAFTLRHMIRSAKALGIKTAVCNCVPVCSERYLSRISRSPEEKAAILKWLGDENAIYRYQERYSRRSEQIAAEEGCLLLDLRSPFLGVRKMEGLFCEDGIHPNEKGQVLIGERLSMLCECYFASMEKLIV